MIEQFLEFGYAGTIRKLELIIKSILQKCKIKYTWILIQIVYLLNKQK